MLTYIGLVLIVIGWGYQLFSKKKEIQVPFVLAYCLGVILLAVDGFTSGLTTIAILNTISFVVAFTVFIKIRK